jgi:hypothetical protein
MEKETLYTIEALGTFGSDGFRLTIHETREVREAKELETILKTLVYDHGFYLRRKR